MEQEPLTFVYVAHLDWDHVWQRPQQLMSRFARYCRVIYVDPPRFIPGGGQPVLRERKPPTGSAAGVRVLQPIFPAEMADVEAEGAPGPILLRTDQVEPVKPMPSNGYQRLWLQLLPAVLAEAGPNSVLCVASPLADYLVAAAQDQVALTIYDCMDDLASFRDGTDEMRRRETHLFGFVDLVFTGGRSMYEARKGRHPYVYCFPSGVDVAHFRQTSDPATRVPVALTRIPQPRLGYFGVLDERIDWALIAGVAAARIDWHWVLVGPRAKVTRSELPKAANIHYLGKQPYTRLPAFLKGFDIATMPFALNQATRYISPTKTPEYLAGGKQVVSTAVADVVAVYDEIVHIANGVDGWVQAVDRILSSTPGEREERLVRATTILQESSWDSTVARMWALIEDRLGQAWAEQAA
jgi:hypothetical protein